MSLLVGYKKRKQLRISSQKELTSGKIHITLYIVIKVKPLIVFRVEQQTFHNVTEMKKFILNQKVFDIVFDGVI